MSRLTSDLSTVTYGVNPDTLRSTDTPELHAKLGGFLFLRMARPERRGSLTDPRTRHRIGGRAEQGSPG